MNTIKKKLIEKNAKKLVAWLKAMSQEERIKLIELIEAINRNEEIKIK